MIRSAPQSSAATLERSWLPLRYQEGNHRKTRALREAVGAGLPTTNDQKALEFLAKRGEQVQRLNLLTPFPRCCGHFAAPYARGAGRACAHGAVHRDVSNPSYHEWKQLRPRWAHSMPGAPPRATDPARRSSGGERENKEEWENKDYGPFNFVCLT